MKIQSMITPAAAAMLMVLFGATASEVYGSCGCSAKPVATKVAAAAAEQKLKPQTTCPVMGGKISKDYYADVNGLRVYACCAGCIPKIKEAPDKYLAVLKANGEFAERAPAPLCTKCREIKGSAACADHCKM